MWSELRVCATDGPVIVSKLQVNVFASPPICRFISVASATKESDRILTFVKTALQTFKNYHIRSVSVDLLRIPPYRSNRSRSVRMTMA